MRIIRYHPAAPLSAHVHCFWWAQRDTTQAHWEHILPSGAVQLLFALHETPIICQPASTSRIVWSRSVVHGPQWRYYLAGPKPHGAVLGVVFRAGRAGAVLGTSMAELADEHVTLGSLWGGLGEELHERLMAATSRAVSFRILEEVLTARIRRRLILHPAIAHALRSSAPPRVSDLVREAGYSPKHFIALFREAVGLTPKHYYRIRRFNQAIQCLVSGSSQLADIAVYAGYSDQAHLTREFRDLAGVTPARYRSTGPGSPLHHSDTRSPVAR